MIDKTVIRGENFTAFSLKVDGDRLFSKYGTEYIKEVAKLLLVKAFASDRSPEETDKEIQKTLVVTVSKAAYNIAIEEMKRIIGESPDELIKNMKDVIEGVAGNEEND